MQQNYRNLRSTARYQKTNHFGGDTKQIRAKQTQSVVEHRSLSHKCKREWGKGMSMLRENPIMADLAERSLPSSDFNTRPHNRNLCKRSHRVCTEAGGGLQSGMLLDLGMTMQAKQAYIISGTSKKKSEAWVIPLAPSAHIVCAQRMCQIKETLRCYNGSGLWQSLNIKQKVLVNAKCVDKYHQHWHWKGKPGWERKAGGRVWCSDKKFFHMTESVSADIYHFIFAQIYPNNMQPLSNIKEWDKWSEWERSMRPQERAEQRIAE